MTRLLHSGRHRIFFYNRPGRWWSSSRHRVARVAYNTWSLQSIAILSCCFSKYPCGNRQCFQRSHSAGKMPQKPSPRPEIISASRSQFAIAGSLLLSYCWCRAVCVWINHFFRRGTRCKIWSHVSRNWQKKNTLTIHKLSDIARSWWSSEATNSAAACEGLQWKPSYKNMMFSLGIFIPNERYFLQWEYGFHISESEGFSVETGTALRRIVLVFRNTMALKTWPLRVFSAIYPCYIATQDTLPVPAFIHL